MKRFALAIAAIMALPLTLSHAEAQKLLLQTPGQLKQQFDGLKPHQQPNIGVYKAIYSRGCTFYEKPYGGGEKWRKTVGWFAGSSGGQDNYAEVVAWVGDYWNDKISSLQCDESAKVKCSVSVHKDTDRRGGEAIFWGAQGIVNLSDWQGGWDNSVSSFAIFCIHLR